MIILSRIAFGKFRNSSMGMFLLEIKPSIKDFIEK